MPLFERVTIVGVGLLGASLGLALKKRGLTAHVTGVGRAGSESLAVARQRGAIDLAATRADEAARDADLVVLCTPVGKFPEMMKTIAPALKPGVVVTDVGSTKALVMEWARELLPAHAAFVGSHPMAGSEKTGPAAAREDLYDGALCLVVEDAANRTPEARLVRSRVEALWRGLGMRTLLVGADEHDRMVAAISHLPHAAAFALAATIARWPESFPAAAGGFCDTTRVAGSDAAMWKDILLTNRGPVTAAIAALQEELAGLREAIERGDGEDILQRLRAARQTREQVLAARSDAGGRA